MTGDYPAKGRSFRMTVVHITDVTRFERDNDRLLDATIQPPVAGTTSDSFAFRIAGSLVGRDGPVSEVQIVHDGRVLRTAPVRLSRPNLAARFPDLAWARTSGFALLVGTLGLPTEFELALRAVLADKTTVRLGVVRGHRTEVQSGYEPRLQPLMVTSLGRTGTTWLMRLLAEHPAIVAYRQYPYEVRAGKYWMHMLRVLAEPADHAKAVANPSSFHVDKTMVGANPFFSPGFTEQPRLDAVMGRAYVEHLAAFCQQSIDDWYGCVADLQGQPDATFFAEKHVPHDVVPLMWELYGGAREVFLVRDFRDVVASILAFNAKRGFASFGRNLAEKEEEHIDQLQRGATRLLDNWRLRADRAHLVRYEDLIAAPTEALRPLLAYVGLDASNATIEGMIARASEESTQLTQHRTSSSPQSSVGRWRRDFSPDLQRLARTAFDDLLVDFGYALDADGNLQASADEAVPASASLNSSTVDLVATQSER